MYPTKRTSNVWLPSIFNDFFDNDWMEKTNATAPAINVVESDTNYRVEVAAPGMRKEDFDIKINDDNDLEIKMEKKSENKEEDKKEHYLRREFSYTRFNQTLILPDDVEKEKINAKVENGVLCIELPKSKPVEQAKVSRNIEIK